MNNTPEEDDKSSTMLKADSLKVNFVTSEASNPLEAPSKKKTYVYACLQCDKRDKSTYKVSSHIKRVHKVWGDTSRHIKRVSKEDEVTPKQRDKLSRIKIQEIGGYIKPSKPLKMARHVKAVPENIRDYKCEHCGFAAPQDVILRRHIQNLHASINPDSGKSLQVSHKHVVDGHKKMKMENQEDAKLAKNCFVEAIYKPLPPAPLPGVVGVPRLQRQSSPPRVPVDPASRPQLLTLRPQPRTSPSPGEPVIPRLPWGEPMPPRMRAWIDEVQLPQVLPADKVFLPQQPLPPWEAEALSRTSLPRAYRHERQKVNQPLPQPAEDSIHEDDDGYY